jgi:hypothetical protein
VPDGTLAAALIALQARLPRITKDDEAQVGPRTYRYANLASIHNAVFPLLAEHGLYWTCCPTMIEGAFVLHYELVHVGGEQIDGLYPLPSSGSPQQIGSAITYARRYTLTAVLGIAPAEDDDDAAETPPVTWNAPANPRTRKMRHVRDTAGEETDWTTGPPDERAPGSISKGQLTRVHMWFTKRGITDRADWLAYAMSVLDLPELGSSKDLSYEQAEQLIKHLEGTE